MNEPMIWKEMKYATPPGEPQSPTTPPTPVNGDAGLASVDVELPDEDETKADADTMDDSADSPAIAPEVLEEAKDVCVELFGRLVRVLAEEVLDQESCKAAYKQQAAA